MFHKYNISKRGYESFVYYDEVGNNIDKYYVQFLYTGNGENDVLNETFQTNLFVDNDDSDKAVKELYTNVVSFCNKESLPVHIKNSLRHHLKIIM